MINPISKFQNSIKNTVFNSNVPYILITNLENKEIEIVAISSPAEKLVPDFTKFVQSGVFFTFINNMNILPVGKTFSDLIYYKSSKLELFGEVLEDSLLLIQINKPYISNSEISINKQSSEKNIYELKSEIVELSAYLESLKKDIEFNRTQVFTMETKLVDELKDVNKELLFKIETLNNKIRDLKELVGSIEKNSLLKFTSNMDLKKILAIITLFISILSSAGLLEGYVSQNVDQNSELNENLERLLELTSEN